MIQILDRYTRAVLRTSETAQTIIQAVEEVKANLSGADLSGADLSRANLSEANLYGANLYGANLFEANLYGANLYGANLSRANLSRANLSRANFYGANLYGANLSRANLYGADLSRANLYGANLSEKETTFAHMQISGVAEWGVMLCLRTSVGVRIIIGCRNFLLSEAREHWANRDDRQKTKMCLNWAEAWAKEIK